MSKYLSGLISQNFNAPAATNDITSFGSVKFNYKINSYGRILNNSSLNGTTYTTSTYHLLKKIKYSNATVTSALSTWTSGSTAAGTYVPICWSPELSMFASLTNSGNSYLLIYGSFAIATGAIPANSWNDICWVAELGLFVAVSSTTSSTLAVITSPDGTTWTSRTTVANGWNSVCWSPELSLLVSVGGTTGSPGVMTSTDGITWTTRTTPANTWAYVCWSPELYLFVAIAVNSSSSGVMTSPDGITWTSRTTPSNGLWQTICWSSELNLFVAVGGVTTTSGVMTSPDGITWTIRTTPSNSWYGVCWSPDLSVFVAVARRNATATGAIMASTNGINWTAYNAPSAALWCRVCWSPELSIFVSACASNNLNNMTSGFAVPNSLNSIFAPSSFIRCNRITGNVGIQMQSAAPQAALHVKGNYTTGASDVGIMMGVTTGNNSRLLISSDPTSAGYITFSVPSLSFGGQIKYDNLTNSMQFFTNTSSTASIYINSSGYVGIGTTTPTHKLTVGGGFLYNYKLDSAGIILNNTTTNGNTFGISSQALTRKIKTSYANAVNCVSNWYARSTANSNSWFNVCWAPDLSLFVAVAANSGSSQTVMTSSDGITWTARTAANNNTWQCVCWSPELRLFVAVGNLGGAVDVMTSPDGITWTTRNPSSGNYWQSVCWSPELKLFVAVAGLGGLPTNNTIMTSPDGITWTTRSAPDTTVWGCVCWAGELNLFVATGITQGSTDVMTSPDGITWTSRTPATLNYWQSVCWSPELGLFVAVGSYGATTQSIMTSTDGITWTSRNSVNANAVYSVCWSPQLSLFLATGSGLTMSSPDGINWTNRTASYSYNSCCWSPELSIFVALGDFSYSVTSQLIQSDYGLSNRLNSLKVPSSKIYVNPSTLFLGIGTTIPNAPLRIVAPGASSAVLAAHFSQSSTLDTGVSSTVVGFSVEASNFYKIGLSYLRNNSFDRGRFSILTNNVADATSAVNESFTVLTSGYVGVSNTNPQAPLHVKGVINGINSDSGITMGLDTSNNATVQINAASTANLSYLDFASPGVDFAGRIIYDNTAGNMKFYAGSASIGLTITGTSVAVAGALSKGSGTFDIQHPLSDYSNDRLIHSFIEGPRADLIYRNTVRLECGRAEVAIDNDCTHEPECSMKFGTFKNLVRNAQIFLQNLEGFDQVIGNVENGILYIECENEHSSDLISWMVIGERDDEFIHNWNMTNSNGYLVTEYSVMK